MNCVEFETVWQERLDHPSRIVEGVDALARHAAACPDCSQKHAGYLVLNAALAGRSQVGVPLASPGWTDRILAASSTMPATPTFGRGLVRLAMAAGVLLAIGLVGNWIGSAWRNRSGSSDSVAQASNGKPRLLSDAVAEFTTASIGLARESSAPAARLGLDVLSAGESTGPDSDSDNEETILGQLGTSLGEEIAPLRGSTRRAFSFLLGPDSTGTDAG